MMEMMESLVFAPGFFRLFLAVMVFANHTTRLALGQAAVYVFFVLSGFWISRMWRKKYVTTARPYTTFIMSRMWRLMPLFVLVNLVTYCLAIYVGFFGGLPTAAWEWVPYLLGNMVILGYGLIPVTDAVLGVVWSLDVEVQFYLLAPLLFTLLFSQGRGWVLLLVGLFSLACLLVLQGHPPFFLLPYLCFFLLGCAADRHSWQISRWFALMTFAGSWLIASGVILELGGHALQSHPLNEFMNIGIGFGFIPFALFTVRQPTNAYDKFAADMSYTLYLAHFPCAAILRMYTENHLTSLSARLPYFAAAWVTALVAAWLLVRFFEQPIGRLREAWVDRQIARYPAEREKLAVLMG